MPSGNVGNTFLGTNKTGITEYSTVGCGRPSPTVTPANIVQTYLSRNSLTGTTITQVRDHIGIHRNVATSLFGVVTPRIFLYRTGELR